MRIKQHTKLLRLFALLVCWCFASATQASDCAAPCAGMPCCQQEIPTHDTAQGPPCCKPQEKLQLNGFEPSKILLALTPGRTKLQLPLSQPTHHWPQTTRIQHVPYQSTPIYLRNCVFRC